MTRRYAQFLAALVLLICASFAIAPHAQVAQAAEQVLYVNTAEDVYPAPTGTCGYLKPQTDKCSLRTAILKANSAPAGDTAVIKFQIPKNTTGYFVEYPIPGFKVETWTINLSQPLDFVTHDAVTIDGFSQAQYIGGNPNTFGPEIIVDGAGVPGTGGLTFQSSNNVVKGLGIINFQTSGGLTGVGIEFRFSSNGNIVQGCYIGINRLGTAPAPNSIGVWLRSSNNTVGGNSTTTDEPNVISGNLTDGVLVEGDNNKVQGNLIGLNASGAFAVPNQGNGVTVRFVNDNLVGSPATAIDSRNRNVISGNGQQGVLIFNGQNNQVAGNLIGTDTTGAEAFPNGQNGVYINSSGGQTTNNIIGGTNFFSRNTISGNNVAGIRIRGDRTTDNKVINNTIGPSSGGALVTGVYSQTGVVVDEGADRNQIGGDAQTEGNFIAGNKGAGVLIAGLNNGSTTLRSDDNIVSGNIIGTQALSNTGGGVIVDTYASRTRIGGTSIGLGNRIENNGRDGIRITGASIISNTVLSNIVRANIGNGVRLDAATTALTTTLSNNVVEANGGDGLQIAGASNTTIFSNTVEANGFVNGVASGTGGTGIQITRGVSTTIDATKVISNGLNGIALVTSDNGKITNTTINGNGSSTLTATATMRNGISVVGSNVISITNNTILTNTLDGVLIGDALFGSQQVRVTDNSISANGGLGINLNPETKGAPGILTYPNHDIDAPFNLHINQDGLVTGRVLATANQPASCIKCLIQVFATNTELLDGQGKTKINAPVEISANGYFTATAGSVPGQLALTATDNKGNTSEFGVFTATLGLDIGPARAGTAAPSDVITYTHRITNTGTVDFTDLSLSAVSSQGWKTAVAPAAPISLAAGQSKPVTLTLTLPKAPDKSVLAGTIDLTRLTVKSTKAVSATASVTDTTTVASAFKLEVDPTAANGLVMPGKVITYSHTLRNVGNLTGTVVLSASTTPSVGWTTNITPTTITLGPGQESSVNVGVGSPAGSVAGASAKTTIGIQITNPTGQSPIFIVDTTKVSLQPLVTIVPNNEGEVEAGQTITFRHFVTNESNGPIKLKLTARKTGLGSTVAFRSATPGVTLGADGSFTLAKGAQLELLVDVTVPERAQAGSSDLVTISLSQEDSTLVGSVQDTVKIRANAFLPRQYLPLIGK